MDQCHFCYFTLLFAPAPDTGHTFAVRRASPAVRGSGMGVVEPADKVEAIMLKAMGLAYET